MNNDMKIFKPRNKEEPCAHWVDCYKNAEWCVEFQSNEGSYFDFYCDDHLKKLTKKEPKTTGAFDYSTGMSLE